MRPRISIRGFVRPSVRPSVCPSISWLVGPSVGPLRLCKNHVFRLFSATMRTYTESTERQTWFESLHYYFCRFICLFVHLPIHICHMINTRRDTVRAHRCPVGLVSCGLASFWESLYIRVSIHPSQKVEKQAFYILVVQNFTSCQ